ncbi:ribosome quality control complex subunit NEMF homolog [Vanessa atalanta]|uniref:ribosome quality control complex subunit NEMF homolog n=1 Tax=Vanessa atalanta TaxID=42275 RepID=UPI001FCE0B30|nr:ribosome quality control complex subunit NEMF homolog [Vanessa atalanta]XP_047536852.1 ribosome quality control complex subunit NEMF homolog [Vanessa atalanta]
MKTRFNTYDIVCMVAELQRLIGMRVNQVYDIDNKTYVIRLQRSEEKSVLLLESANRFHTTQFEWPKNVAPSGFTMKLRKHLKNKRLEKLTQLGIDRIVDLQFGSGEAAYHVILELYDRGNIVLTDFEWTILNVLRPHVEGDKVRFAVKEKYPLDRAKTSYEAPNADALKEIFGKSKPGDNIKKILNPNLEYGAAVIDHVLLENGLAGNMKVSQDPTKGFYMERDLDKLVTALKQAEMMIENGKNQIAKGYIIQKREERPNPEGGGPTYLLTNQDFHPMLFAQTRNQPHTEYETFDRAVDEFYSALEGQKIDLKTVHVEREAMKKLQNVRKDHDKRITELERLQLEDRKAAEMISRNEPLIEQARLAIQAAIANQMSWDDITLLVKTAQDNNDPVASSIKQLKLNTNHITLLLQDPYDDGNSEDDECEERLKPMLVDIDLSLTAFANARRYYDQKRTAAKKQQKTLESADKALKSAERKTKQTLKEAHTISNISKARKTYWFEKFYWFISSDNYLVIAGRDQQQNELLVKRYMRASDAYVHADVSGAASVLVKCRGAPPSPKALCEAGQAAVAYSVAWEAKVLTRAWWVFGHQVSKSAPTGEYLTTGSFMIRGKKNYLLPELLQFGFSFMFRLEDSCIERHRDDRKSLAPDDSASDVTSTQDTEEEQEIVVSDDDETSDKEESKKESLDTIKEEVTNVKTEKPSDKNDRKEKKSPETSPAKVNKETVSEESEIQDNNEEDRNDQESGSDSDSSEAGVFDTHIKVDHGTGEVFIASKSRTMSEMSDKSDDSKLLSFPSLPKKGGKKTQKEQKQQEIKKEEKQGPKRGQKSKLKKIKEKYKNQDDEDRALMMELLKPDKSAKDSKKAQKQITKGGKSKAASRLPKIPQPVPVLLEAESDGEEPEPELEQSAPDADIEMLCQLTGCPLPEDELLFAVPVVAPYSSLHNYKFKVKLTPGSNKRGKAAKTAVQVFLRDKNSSPRERDLLKAVKEENVARNFPGKVKLSAPQLHKHKK